MTSAQETDRLMRGATRTRADGSRGVRARWAWRRLVRACAGGDLAAQDAVRSTELPEADVLDLLAAAPDEPADRAAYLTLIGQDAQRQALDPDGSLLALAYRAAAPEVRERLRTVMAVEGDADAIRVVVTGDQRDRLAEMTYEELDYLGHQLAERQDWDELRRLARDLPLAKAVAAARLLPEPERAPLPLRSAAGLRATVDRLPRDRLITYETRTGGTLCASFSPDSSELALKYEEVPYSSGSATRLHVETLQIATGEVASRFSRFVRLLDTRGSVLHLGDEIISSLGRAYGHRYRIVRVVPDVKMMLGPPTSYLDLRRSSDGAVAVDQKGLAFIDPGADRLRHQPVPRFAEMFADEGPIEEQSVAMATFAEARLVALLKDGEFCVVDEDGNVVHESPRHWNPVGGHPVISFLSPNSLALNWQVSGGTHYTEMWEFPPGGAPHRTGRHRGPIRERWPLETWRGLVLDDAFAARIHSANASSLDVSWLQNPAEPDTDGSRKSRTLLAVAPDGDMFVTSAERHITKLGRYFEIGDFEVHSPHLPATRELLERPLLRSSPKDLRRARELRAKIGDPAVREALGLLAAYLTSRFGDEIALGTGPVAAGGPTDITLAKDQGDE